MEKIEVEHCDFVHVHDEIVKDVREHMPAVEELQELADFLKCSEIPQEYGSFASCYRERCASAIWHRHWI